MYTIMALCTAVQHFLQARLTFWFALWKTKNIYFVR